MTKSRKKGKELNISLRKTIPIFIIISVILYFALKKDVPPKQPPPVKESIKVEKSTKKENIFVSRSSKISFDDVAKLMEIYPPNFSKDCDTVKWQKSEVIRYLSIDTNLQKKTETLVNQAKARYAAAVAINPKTGQILAFVSKSDAEHPKIADNLCLSSKFPAASIFKTITAEAAFEYTNIACSSTVNFVGRNTTLYKNQFLPEDFGENSNSVSFAEAYGKSINPIFGWLAIHEIGREKLTKSAMKFGWNTKVPFEMQCDASFFPETTPENLKDTVNIAEIGCGFNSETTLTPLLGALIASVPINGGIMMVPTIVDSITDKSGKKLYSANMKKWKKSTAHDIADSLKLLMQQTTKMGSARTAFTDMKKYSLQRATDLIFGGKTGTKDSKYGRNEWFVGFAQDTTAQNEICIATSVCLVQNPMFVFRPSQISADIMLDYIRKTKNQTDPEK
jgi:cell division protein FtsI/penicillin-binding protein 2